MTQIQLLAQILPLLVFIVVDSIWNDVKISIVSAIVFAAVQLFYFYYKTDQFDWFVLIDMALIVGLGSVSIIFKNEMFFKIKPAIIEGAMVIFILVLLFLPDRFLLNYFGRMMPKGMVLNPAMIGSMKFMLLLTCGYILLHIGAIVYTAYFSSRRVWAIVSGPGFYLLFIPVMIFILVKRIRMRRVISQNRVGGHSSR